MSFGKGILDYKFNKKVKSHYFKYHRRFDNMICEYIRIENKDWFIHPDEIKDKYK